MIGMDRLLEAIMDSGTVTRVGTIPVNFVSWPEAVIVEAFN